jgi:aspartyl-tRNA(Asn)/glutamyl-tRNA(Gln) amidotransferase subunit A
VNPHHLSLRALADALAAGELTSEEVTRACLERIRATDERLGAFLHVAEETALAQARASDRRRREGRALGLLDGVPVGLKDNLSTEGIPTTCASRILEGYLPPFDATVVKRLKEAGAVILGKLNMDEFAMCSTTESSAFKPTRNPWDLSRSPGGSSGGSAAATAARQVFGALGSDTGGSIRQPASHCGVVGIKPTYGRCSRHGVVAYASSLDQVGTFGRTVEDAAILLQTIAGHDPNDSTSLAEPVPDWVAALEGASVEGMRLGIPKEYFVDGLDPEVEGALRAAIATLVSMGAKVEEISLPHTEYAIAAYYVVAPAEASSNLSRFDGIRYGLSIRDGSLRDLYARTRGTGFGPEVKRRVIAGTWLLSSGNYEQYSVRAQKVRTLIRRDFDEAFAKVDAILTPVAPTAARRLGERSEDPVETYLSDTFTLACNLAGLPGMSVPCGFTSKGLPVGMQLLGKRMDEATLFRLGAAYQQATDWHRQSPPEVA